MGAGLLLAALVLFLWALLWALDTPILPVERDDYHDIIDNPDVEVRR